MAKMFYVYCYKNKINGKRYIGKTNSISDRKRRHRRNAFVDNVSLPFYNAIRKYGEDNFEFSILDKFQYEYVILDLEIFYIKLFQSNNKDFGYNITAGGEGSTGAKHNENQIRANKERVGTKNGNSKLTEETVHQIYDDYKCGSYFNADLAKKYNVSEITVERILSGRAWKHLNLDIAALYPMKRKNITRGYLEAVNE